MGLMAHESEFFLLWVGGWVGVKPLGVVTAGGSQPPGLQVTTFAGGYFGQQNKIDTAI